jgi:hypothetical protein
MQACQAGGLCPGIVGEVTAYQGVVALERQEMLSIALPVKTPHREQGFIASWF